jgi:AraC-like DNA-binding protein
MNIGQQILFLISALGAFNGFVLSLYLFINKKSRSIATFLLGVLLLVISIRVVTTVFIYFNPQIPEIYRQIGPSACFLIGPSLYYFFKAVLTRASSIPLSWKWNWGALLGILLLGCIIIPYQTFPDTWYRIIDYIIIGQWLIYLVASGFLLKPVLKMLFTNPAGLDITQKCLLLVFFGNGIIFLGYQLSYTGVMRGMCVGGAVSFSFILYLTVFFYLYRTKAENILQVDKTEPLDRPEKRKIAATDAQVWIEKLEKAVSEKKLYKDPNLKLNDLAQEINIPAHQLSQLLNENVGKSFSTYINEYRINEACKLITTNHRLTFEAIGYEVGYNSKSTFYTAFKKVKDTTPALFKESIEKIAAK